ncbi:MAG: SH3 domain-containing protein [Anaerolineales bacterium]|nr:SH3 domain-containing protein [Anaerolineales bacterium]
MRSSRLITLVRFLIVTIAAGLCLAAMTSAANAAPLQQSTQPVAIAIYDQVNIRTGPSTTYPVSGVLLYGESCPVVGRDTATGWWMLRCPVGRRAGVS